MNIVRYMIKKTYSLSYKMLAGKEAWLHSDDPSSQTWFFTKLGATSFDHEQAVKMMAEAMKNRPDDMYEIVPLD